ncbi:MAG: hypothetical protein OZ921_01245 [Sorangiineae bacterium]|nr:hypothetical protein [Polyangiaceae bacterium]MEB2321109.1 hypothetical protein [Sorangiineae bacterium]
MTAARGLVAVALVSLATSCNRVEREPAATQPPRSAEPASAVRAASGAPPLDASTFARLFDELSERDGGFFSDNLVSNETSMLQVAPLLRARVAPGRAYLGVGPEQNFTYIALTRPSLAFIIDIRRDNALLHLLYKAIFERAETRAEFLSLLLGRPLREGVGPGAESSVAAVLSAVESSRPEPEWFAREHAALVARLTGPDRVDLSSADVRGLEKLHRAFFERQLELRFELKEKNGRDYPTLRELFEAKAPDGRPLGFLASEASFTTVRDLERANRIIPVVGDFAGEHALRAVGAELRRRSLTVGVFYVSNVEQYVMKPPAWQRWVSNVGALPTDAESIFIRAYLDQGRRHPAQLAGHRTATVLQPMSVFLTRGAARPYRTFLALTTDGVLGDERGEPTGAASAPAAPALSR